MKLCCLFVLALLICACPALDYYPGPAQSVLPAADREYSFAYHNGSDDFHFYGTNIWAVRFNFHAVYPNLSLCQFAVSKALLYFPQTTDSVKVELFSDTYGLPGTRLSWASAPVQSNYLELNFPQVVQDDTLWLLVTYATNDNNRFVSASTGTGTHSYFWNTNATNPYFQSLASAGYNAEFLFGLGGEFVLSNPDLELMDFDLRGTIRPRETVGPTFRIYNHSELSITDAVVNINLYSPDPEFAFFDPVAISETIAPNSIYEYNEDSIGYDSHQFSLPPQALQLKLRAALSSGIQDNDPQANNVSIINRFSLQDEYPVYLAENFQRYSLATPLLNLQDPLNPPQIHALNYFPILSDTLGNIGSQLRFSWYGFNSLPRCVLGGEYKINGFGSNWGSQYTQYRNQSLEQRSFISDSDCRLSYTAVSDILSGTLTLTNERTLLYAVPTEYNLVTNTRLFIGLFRKAVLAGSTRYVLSRWIQHAAALSGPLGAGESVSTTFSVPMNNLNLAELAQNYRLYYWLQLADGSRILYSDWQDFTSVVSNQDELINPPQLILGPNPLRLGQDMKIALSNGQGLHKLSIFNIRGQELLRFTQAQTEYRLKADQFPSSGIYFLCLEYTGKDGKPRSINKKISIIK